MITKVVNIKNSNFDIYIGRGGHGQDGYFGNDHLIGYCRNCDQVHDREKSIMAFKNDFNHRIDRDLKCRSRVESLKGKRLGCFCAPLDCHGDVYVEWLEGNTR